MKKLFAFVCALMVSFAANAQVLYKISGNGLKNDSYILGSCHFVGGSFLDTIPGAKRVLNQVQQICGEIDMRYVNNPDTAMAYSQLMMMPDDSVARKIMTEEQFNELCNVVKEQYDLDLSQPQYAMLLKLYPTMMMITIPQLAAMIKLQKSIAEGTTTVDQQQVVMDLYVQHEAQQASKPVVGLETYSFQIRLLTSLLDMPLQEQFLGVIDAFKNIEKGKEQMKLLNDAYHSLNLDNITNYLNSIEGFDNIVNRIFDSRNEVWADKMPTIMSDKSTLFVVGVGHLPGDKGVLSLLQSQGYKISPVKK
ncbi:MAG: TraB/GumN family protein [Bacteroidales bacterium]|nr:TraB/GumN family protein [Bacteroidales bacterium]